MKAEKKLASYEIEGISDKVEAFLNLPANERGSCEEFGKKIGLNDFRKYGKLLCDFHDAVVEIDGKKQLDPASKDDLLKQLLDHKNHRAIKHFFMERHGFAIALDLEPNGKGGQTQTKKTIAPAPTKAAAPKKSSLTSSDSHSNQPDLPFEKNTVGISSAKKLYELLVEANEKLVEADIEQNEKEIESYLKEATDYMLHLEKEHLETFLYIGAALIRVKLRIALSSANDKELVEKRFSQFLTKVLARWNLRSERTVYRIADAYRTALAAYTNQPVPKLKSSPELYDFYKKALPEIPKLVEDYVAGRLEANVLKAVSSMPFLTISVDGGDSGDTKKADTKPAITYLKGGLAKNPEKFYEDWLEKDTKDKKQDFEAALASCHTTAKFLQQATSKLRGQIVSEETVNDLRSAVDALAERVKPANKATTDDPPAAQSET